MSNLNMGSAGAGTSLHMSGEWLKLATGIQSVHVPFKGSGPQVVALAGGEIDWAMENYGAVLPMVQTAACALLAVASPSRHPQAPDVPTFKEAGLPDVNLSTWIFLMAPAGTPEPCRDAAQHDSPGDPSHAGHAGQAAAAGLRAVGRHRRSNSLRA